MQQRHQEAELCLRILTLGGTSALQRGWRRAAIELRDMMHKSACCTLRGTAAPVWPASAAGCQG